MWESPQRRLSNSVVAFAEGSEERAREGRVDVDRGGRGKRDSVRNDPLAERYRARLGMPNVQRGRLRNRLREFQLRTPREDIQDHFVGLHGLLGSIDDEEEVVEGQGQGWSRDGNTTRLYPEKEVCTNPCLRVGRSCGKGTGE